MYKFGLVPFANNKDKRIASGQWQELQGNRQAARNTMVDLGVDSGLIKQGDLATNQNLLISEMYRDLDSTVTMEPKAIGTQATLQRLLSKAVPVHIGKKVIMHRRTGEAGKAGRSMSGQTGIVIDNTDSNYQKAIVPIFDAGFGRDWRDVEGQRSEMFDALVEDAEEVEYTLLQNLDDFMWNGDNTIAVDGTSWGGLKADASIATASLLVRWDLAATAGMDIVNEVLKTVDVLRINNKCSDQLTLAVSPQIMTNWLRPTTVVDSTYGNIYEFVTRTLAGRIGEIYEDAALTDNEAFFYVDSTQALHAKVGMGVSTYALKRDMHNSPYNFVKWCAFGFMSKSSYAGLKKALYATT